MNYGGQTAGPIFKNVATQLMSTIQKQNLAEYISTKESFVFIPDFVGMKKIDALNILKKKNVRYDIVGDGHFVVSQSPRKGLYEINEISRVDLTVSNPKVKIMPYLVGLTIREAILKINHFKFKIDIVGSGIIKSQSIKARTRVKEKQTLKIICK